MKPVLLKIFLILTLITTLHTTTNTNAQAQDDAGSGHDAPADPNQAVPVELDVWYNGVINETQIDFGDASYTSQGSGADKFDAYVVKIPSSGYLGYEVNADSSIYVLILRVMDEYPDLENNIAKRDRSIDNPDQRIAPILHSGFYVFKLSSASQTIYNFRLSFTSGIVDIDTQNDSGTNGDVTDCPSGYHQSEETIITLEKGVTVTLNGEVNSSKIGEDGLRDLVDCYTLKIEENGYLSMERGNYKPFTGHALYTVDDDGTLNLISTFKGFGPNMPLIGPASYKLKFNLEGPFDNHWNYTLTNMTFEPTEFVIQNDAGIGRDAPPLSIDQIETLGPEYLKFNQIYTGTVGTGLVDLEYSLKDYDDTYRLPEFYYGALEINLNQLSEFGEDSYLSLNIWYKTPMEEATDVCYHSISIDDAEKWCAYYETDHNIVTEPQQTFSLWLNNTDQITGNPLHPYAISIHTGGDNVKYQLEIKFDGSAVPVPENAEESLEIRTTAFVVAATGLLGIGGVALYTQYTKKNGSVNFGKSISSNTKNVVKSIFGAYASSYFTIGQNIISKEAIEEEKEKLFPPEILDQKFLMHPIRLSMCKILTELTSMPSAELRQELGITWGDFATHSKALKAKGFIRADDNFVEGAVGQIINIEPLGVEKYEKLIATLINFIDQSPLYNKYIEEALELSKHENN